MHKVVPLFLGSAATAVCGHEAASADVKGPLLIAHRGGTSKFPQASLKAYESVLNVTDLLECDLTITKDGVMVCQHEPDLSISSNAWNPEFRPQLPTANITREWLNPVLDFDRRSAAFLREDAKPYDGWYTPDYEYNSTIRFLSAPTNSPHDHYPLATLEQIWELALSTMDSRKVGVYLEIKHSTWHQGRRNRDVLSVVLDFLRAKSSEPDQFHFHFPVYLQTFEIGDLIRLRYHLGFDSHNVFITGLSTVLHTTYNLPPDCCLDNELLRQKMRKLFEEDDLGKFVRLPGTFGEMFFGTLAPESNLSLFHNVDSCLGPSMIQGGSPRSCDDCRDVVGGLKILPISLRMAQDAPDRVSTVAQKKAICQDVIKQYASHMFPTCPTNPMDTSYTLKSFYAYHPPVEVSHAMDISCLVDAFGIDLRYVKRHPQIVKEVKDSCIKVHIWTIKSEEDMRLAMQYGADGVFTDEISMSRAVMTQHDH